MMKIETGGDFVSEYIGGELVMPGDCPGFGGSGGWSGDVSEVREICRPTPSCVPRAGRRRVERILPNQILCC